MTAYARLEISDLCTACGACILTCHAMALTKHATKPRFDPRICDLCYECVEICPRDAISEVVG